MKVVDEEAIPIERRSRRSCSMPAPTRVKARSDLASLVAVAAGVALRGDGEETLVPHEAGEFVRAVEDAVAIVAQDPVELAARRGSEDTGGSPECEPSMLLAILIRAAGPPARRSSGPTRRMV